LTERLCRTVGLHLERRNNLPILEYDWKQVTVEEDDFLVNFEEWNKKIAQTYPPALP